MSHEKKLCLTMIVKNESQIIERCLDSVKDLVDCVSICDTGSTDQTVAIVEDYLKRNRIPGKVHHHQWQNFGHNRTLSAEAAQVTLHELGFSLSNTYLLLLDADMVLKVEPTFNRQMLTHDSYTLVQRAPGLSYHNTRLIKASLPWKCLGVTHEYWSSVNRIPALPLYTLKIEDLGDGGCKADKLERDSRLLTQGLQDEPNNERYMFYLAQTYKSLEKYDEAIHWYKKRIDKGGWIEEVWYSKMMIGEMYEKMGYWDEAQRWYLAAYEHNSARAEPLQRIAKYYRLQGQNHLAYLFAKQGSQIPYPKNQLLFISDPVYDYLLDEELSIAAYYTPYRNEGFEAANRLIMKRNLPAGMKDTALRNILFYLPNLKNAVFRPILIDAPLLAEGSQEKYNPMNPTIQKTKEGYDVICRTVNYMQTNGFDHRSRDPKDARIKTKNFLLQYDKDFTLISQKEIVDNISQESPESRVMGLEDCRLVRLQDKNWFVGTSFNFTPGKIRPVLCQLQEKADSSPIIPLAKLTPLNAEPMNRCEKNWLPFVKNNELFAIYGYDPFLIFKVDPVSGQCDPVVKTVTCQDLSGFRGSAPPIEFDNGYLFLVHEVIYDNRRYYMHRFVFLDKDFNIKKASKPFVFMHKGIEYTCGMTLDHTGNFCVIPIGVEDKEAHLCFVDVKTVESMLEPLR